MKQTIRILTLHEAMGGASIFSGKALTEEDMLKLMHAFACVKHGVVSKEALDIVLTEERFATEITEGVETLLRDINLYSEVIATTKEQVSQDTEEVTLSDVVGLLVAEGGIAPSYVLDDMELWEIPMYVNGINARMRKHLEEQRLFAFIGVSPWLDNKGGAKSPKDILHFAWDEEGTDADKFLENNYDDIYRLLNGKE